MPWCTSLLDTLDHLHWSTLFQPVTFHSSLKITNRSFRHAAPHLSNELPAALHVPYQSGASSSCSSSHSDAGPVVDFLLWPFPLHSHPKTPLFSVFPSIAIYPSGLSGIWPVGVWQSLAAVVFMSAADYRLTLRHINRASLHEPSGLPRPTASP